MREDGVLADGAGAMELIGYFAIGLIAALIAFMAVTSR